MTIVSAAGVQATPMSSPVRRWMRIAMVSAGGIQTVPRPTPRTIATTSATEAATISRRVRVVVRSRRTARPVGWAAARVATVRAPR